MTAYLTHRPARGTMLLGFGPRPKPTPTSPAIHYGQDYGWGGGDQIFAARSGRVAAYGPAGAYGNRLIIDHGDGFQTWYCHLASRVAAVGSNVAGGVQVAVMGDTGNVTAKHLHFELRRNGVAVDPAPYFTSSAGSGTTPIRRNTMATLFKHADKSLWALAGDSPGTPANWLETADSGFAGQLRQQHGGEAVLSAGSWVNWKAAYSSPVATNGASGGGFDPSPIVAAINALGPKIDALPAENDRYRDGRKNAS